MVGPLKPIPAAFWRSASGREPVREWLRGMAVRDRQTIGDDLRKVQFGWPIGMPLVRKLADHLWELRTSLPGNREARLLFTTGDAQLVILHGFMKKSQKTPAPELDLALRRLREIAS
jgi:phage-related protein